MLKTGMRRNCRAFLDLNALRACDQLGSRKVEIGVMPSDTPVGMDQAHTVICDIGLTRVTVKMLWELEGHI